MTAETDVLVVGGGPVGLATAVELGRRGIRCVVTEPRERVRHDRPRAKTTSARSMEHFRRLGLADRIREASYLPVAWSSEAVFCTTLLGREIARFRGCFALDPEPSDVFAEAGQQVPQPVVEEVLRETVGELDGCTLALGTRLERFEERDGDVRAELVTAAGERREVLARYVVGCDGGGGVVRSLLGIPYIGSTDTRPNFNVVFRAPGLAERHRHGDAIHYWILSAEAPALLGRYDLRELPPRARPT